MILAQPPLVYRKSIMMNASSPIAANSPTAGYGSMDNSVLADTPSETHPVSALCDAMLPGCSPWPSPPCCSLQLPHPSEQCLLRSSAIVCCAAGCVSAPVGMSLICLKTHAAFAGLLYTTGLIELGCGIGACFSFSLPSSLCHEQDDVRQ